MRRKINLLNIERLFSRGGNIESAMSLIDVKVFSIITPFIYSLPAASCRALVWIPTAPPKERPRIKTRSWFILDSYLQNCTVAIASSKMPFSFGLP